MTVAAMAAAFSFAGSALAAGTLTCTVGTSCVGGVVVMRMAATSNSHAELASQSNYAQLVCCSGVPGLSNSCSGTHAVVAKLSGATNAHVEENSLSDYGNDACISVPTGGAVTIAYQNGNCTGYDTTLASIQSPPTNSHVGNAAAYTRKICGYALNGNLSADIVNGSGTPVASPSVVMSAVTSGYSCQTATGTFGVTAQKLRVENATPNPSWTLAVAATGGPTALWSAGTPKYDFNDASSCTDGGDADGYGGQMTVDPSAAAVTPKSGCTNTGISMGASAAFAEGSLDSLTMLSAGVSAGTNCWWDMTGIGISQAIPADQPSGSYALNLTVTVTAN